MQEMPERYNPSSSKGPGTSGSAHPSPEELAQRARDQADASLRETDMDIEEPTRHNGVEGTIAIESPVGQGRPAEGDRETVEQPIGGR